MTGKTMVQILHIFAQAYPAQFNKMSENDKRTMLGTWASAFGMFPDDHFITAAQLAVKKSAFMPSLNEMSGYLRRAELLAQARAIDEKHLREGKTFPGAGLRSGETDGTPRIGTASSDPAKIEEAREIEKFLLWMGDKPENAHATAWCDVDGGDQQ